MKKYDIFSLYVVKLSTYYLICSKNLLRNSYIDVLTKERVEVKDESLVTPLLDYYPACCVSNCSNGKHLMLTKDSILKKCLEINVDETIYMYKQDMIDQVITNPEENHIINILENKVSERIMSSEDAEKFKLYLPTIHNELITYLEELKFKNKPAGISKVLTNSTNK